MYFFSKIEIIRVRSNYFFSKIEIIRVQHIYVMYFFSKIEIIYACEVINMLVSCTRAMKKITSLKINVYVHVIVRIRVSRVTRISPVVK